jgi:hypothetical protein
MDPDTLLTDPRDLAEAVRLLRERVERLERCWAAAGLAGPGEPDDGHAEPAATH